MTKWRCHPRFHQQRVVRIASPARRWYSILHELRAETVDVPSGTGEAITLSIYKTANTNPAPPLIISLPSALPTAPSPVPFSLLPFFTIVHLSLSWSATHRFPLPLHATLAAYDWILANLTPSPIGIYGVGLGGTLATSTALTECRPSASKNGGVRAVAAKNAVLDWTSIATSLPPSGSPSPPSSKKAKRGPDPAPQDLYVLRSQLFRNPGAAFDAFASPILFFRTSGLTVPSEFPVTEQVSSPSPGMELKAPRKSHLVFPPRKSGLRIPDARFAVTGAGGKGGEGAWFRTQADEMVALMRRSIVMHEPKERFWDGVGETAMEMEARRRVDIVDVGNEKEGAEGEWAVEWFKSVLGDGTE